MYFAQRLDIVVNVLQHMIAQNNIKRIVGEWHPVNVHFNFGQWRLNVGGNVLGAVSFFKRLHEALLWRDVENVQRLLKKIGFVAQVEPNKAVALE